MDIIYIYENEFKISYVDGIRKVYESVGWIGHNNEKIEEIYKASTHVVLVKNDDEIIAVARALSDGVFNAAIYDVVVKEKHQGQGIAKRILEEFLNEFDSLSCIHLISTTENVEFYRKLGFKKLKTGMAIYRSLKLENEYTE